MNKKTPLLILFWVACWAIASIKIALGLAATEAAIPFIVPLKISQRLASKDEIVRAKAVYDLRDSIRQQPETDVIDAVAVIAEKLKDPSGYVRRAAASSLGDLGPLASMAKANLLETIRSYPDSDASVFAIDAIGALGKPDPVFQQLLEWYLTTTQIASGRPAALNALKKYASVPLSPTTISYVERLLEENKNDALLEDAALGCLSKLAPSDAILLGYLETYSKSNLVMKQLLVIDCLKGNLNSFQKAELELLLAPLRESKYAEIASDAKKLTKGNTCNQ